MRAPTEVLLMTCLYFPLGAKDFAAIDIYVHIYRLVITFTNLYTCKYEYFFYTFTNLILHTGILNTHLHIPVHIQKSQRFFYTFTNLKHTHRLRYIIFTHICKSFCNNNGPIYIIVSFLFLFYFYFI